MPAIAAPPRFPSDLSCNVRTTEESKHQWVPPGYKLVKTSRIPDSGCGADLQNAQDEAMFGVSSRVDVPELVLGTANGALPVKEAV